MLAYDEFSTFRTPKSEVRSPKSSRSSPERVEALDDLHRALYGSLHPAAAIQESDRELVEGDDESSGTTGWIENHALTAALGVVACFALYSWMKRPKEAPLHGPPDVPFVPNPTPSSTP